MNRRDEAVIANAPSEPRRDVIACTIAAYRREDRLAEGDAVPELTLRRLDGVDTVDLHGDEATPLVLIFGSYT